MPLPLFLGAATSGDIYRYGSGGEAAVLSELETWAFAPAGDDGDVVFRKVSVTINAANGYDIGVTPILDGVASTEQFFARSGFVGLVTLEAPIALRGTRLAVKVRLVSRSGAVEFVNAQPSYTVIRQTP